MLSGHLKYVNAERLLFPLNYPAYSLFSKANPLNGWQKEAIQNRLKTAKDILTQQVHITISIRSDGWIQAEKPCRLGFV
jgi:hypothetical protein